MSEAVRATDTRDEEGFLVFTRRDLGAMDARGSGWYGMMLLVASEAALFSCVLFSYFYMAFHYGRDWLPDKLPSFTYSGPNTGFILVGTAAVFLADRAIRRNARWLCTALLAVGFVLSCLFLWFQWMEWSGKPFGLDMSSYSSVYFLVTGVHVAHVVAGVLMLLAMTIWTAFGMFDMRRRDFVTNTMFYWLFVAVLWVAVLLTVYVSPYMFYR